MLLFSKPHLTINSILYILEYKRSLKGDAHSRLFRCPLPNSLLLGSAGYVKTIFLAEYCIPNSGSQSKSISGRNTDKMSERAYFVVNIFFGGDLQLPEMCTCIAHRDFQQILNI